MRDVPRRVYRRRWLYGLIAVGAGVSILSALLFSLTGLARGASPAHGASPSQAETATEDNLLVNGTLNGDYYWEYPNHWVAPNWYRWWIDGSALPEYYYEDTICVDDGSGRCRSQRLHRLPQSFEAGIYQVVTVTTPCIPYEFTAWSRSHSLEGANPHVRIGLDPAGTDLVPAGPDHGAVFDGLPPHTVWSAEQTTLFTWQQLAVTAEAAGDHITAIFYAHPQPGSSQTHFYSLYWDAASLVASSFPDDRLPAPTSWQPSGFITNVTYTLDGTDLTIQWETPQPASTQVWYTIWETGSPISETQSYSHTVYFPLISRFEPPTAYMTPLDVTPTTTHQATIPNVQAGQRIFFAALSRRPGEGVCVTETSAVYDITLGSTTSTTLTPDRAADIFSGSITRR